MTWRFIRHRQTYYAAFFAQHPTKDARGKCQVGPSACKIAWFNTRTTGRTATRTLFHLLPLTLQPTVGFGLSNNVLPFFPICHQLSPSSHSRHFKISFYFLFPSFPGSSPSSRPSSSWVKIFLGILSSSILSKWPNQLILCPFTHFTIFSPLLIPSSSRFVRLFHSLVDTNVVLSWHHH